MISKKETQHIAKLARLGLSEKEIEKMQKELSSILDYVEKLKEVDVSKLNQADVLIGQEALREDLPKSSKEETLKKLMEMVPEKSKDYVKIKSVLNESD